MKKILFLLTILSTCFTHANDVKKDRTPEQIASIKSKKMTLALDLNSTQQSQVEKLLLIQAKDRKLNKTKRKDREKLTEEQKFARHEAALEKNIAMKREMKSILNVDQYSQWLQMMAKRSKGKKKGSRHRKGRDR
ncbi:hypothetical protein [uncultured Nonlabens sp.]|uniref:hypothetical protein n=1 Tax=uncultured Nonlabens sp. TaxID=859306 RepID=UPI00262A78A0|nr:hypothetical protein [uncultured Nonlabens sp.]